MLDHSKLNDVIEKYKQDFNEHWKDEKYKWEAVKHFQDNWDIDADDYAEMLKKSLAKTDNLLASGHSFPRRMIKKFAEVEPKTVRSMFMILLDESKPLDIRIRSFIDYSEEIRAKYENAYSWKNHYQTINSISVYLWLMYPDKYYIYKYDVFKKVAGLLDDTYRPKANGAVDNVINGYKMYDDIRAVLKSDIALIAMLDSALDDSCYPDNELVTATMDLGYYIATYHNNDTGDSDDQLPSLEEKEMVDIKNDDNTNCKNSNEPVIWKISHGGNNRGVPKELRDTLEKRKVVTLYRYTHPLATSKISQGESFMTEIKSGDYFYLCYGGEIVLFGQFLNNPAKPNPEMSEPKDADGWYEREYKLIAESKDRNRYNGIKKWWTPNHNSTCVKVSDNDLFEELILQPYFGLTLEDLQQKNKYESYTKQDFLKEVYMTEEQYTTLTSLLEHKQNIILQGAPGVGKTFTAKRLAYSMMGEKDDSRIEFIQFHQSYSYEDFIMGYRPDSDNGFELKEGVFYRFCEKARKDSERDYFFIIDEINRGNLSKIFGELLMLIEKDYRRESATLAYRDEKFYVPENLYIIGMMNTADRSLAMIDYALRRRFSFFEMEPGFDSDGFKKYSDSLNSERFKKLIEQIKALNKEIEADTSLGKGFCIGHSYLCNIRPEECTDEKLKMIVEYDIIPMLNEYWFDDKNNREKWSDNLRGIFNDS